MGVRAGSPPRLKSPAAANEHGTAFLQARQEMLDEGLFDTDYSYYLKLGTFIASWFVVSLLLSLDVVSRVYI